MTIVYAFLDFGDGGAQRLTLTTWRHLDRSRFQPVLLCVRRAGALAAAAEAEGVPVRVLGRLARPFDVGAVPAIARALRELGADVVHVPLYSRASPYVRLAARLAGVRLVVAQEWSRPAAPSAVASAARRQVDRWLLALAPATRFIAVSEAHRTELIATGVAAGQVEVIYSGIDSERFDSAKWDRLAAREELGRMLRLVIEPDRPLVVVPARLHPMKGHADLLAAVRILSSRMPDVLVLCAGTGPLRRVLPALAEAAGLDRQVRFIGQWADMALLYAAADVVALSSRVEGLPSAMLEAFAARRAVVATDVGGVAEALTDGQTGLLVPPRRPAALAGALAELLSDPAARTALADRAYAHVQRAFQAEPATRRLEVLYERWWRELGGRPAAGGHVAHILAQL